MTNDKKRLTFIVSGLTPTLGLERVTLRLMETLNSKYDVRAICVGGSNEDKRLFPSTEVLGSSLTGWRRIRSLARLFSCSRRNDLGIVILVGVWTAVPWLLVSPRYDATIVWEHTLLREKLPQSRALRLLEFMARLLYRRASHVVGVSQPVTDDLAEYNNIDSLTTIPNLVDTPPLEQVSAFARARTKERNNILCVGSLSTIKAHHLAIAAVSELGEDFELTVVGKGPNEQALRKLATELRVSDRVRFTGYLNRHLVRDEMNKASVLLHCSVAETFGLVYAEAADVGLPVVSVETRVGRQMIPRFAPGWLCKPTPQGIAETILETANKPILPVQVFVEAAKRRSDEFGTSRILEKWDKVLQEVCLSHTEAAPASSNTGTSR